LASTVDKIKRADSQKIIVFFYPHKYALSLMHLWYWHCL